MSGFDSTSFRGCTYENISIMTFFSYSRVISSPGIALSRHLHIKVDLGR